MSGGDPLGNAIQQQAMGQSGILTGTSGINVIGYNQYANAAYGAAAGRRAGSPRPYVMTPLLRRMLDAVPWWVHVALAGLAATMMVVFLLSGGGAGLPVAASGWAAQGGLTVAAGFAGLVALPIAFRLADLGWKILKGLTILALSIAVVAGIGGALYWVGMTFL